MKYNNQKLAIGATLLVILVTLFSQVTAFAAADSLDVKKIKPAGVPFVDRIAVRTNALDWMLTIPNIAMEFDLMNSEFNNLTFGLSAKCNWNTLHYNMSTERPYAPPMAYNLLDVRPELRYWYRTRTAKTKGKFSIESFLKDKKNPKTWRANYVGAYVNYANYTFKFGKKGMQGHAYGVGASTGYSIPMYEYKNGAIDVELGFSLGLQLCTRDMFMHNPDGYFYTKVLEDTKGLHMTPFPVASDLRVAFVWRHKSIKDKVKEDADKNRVVAYFRQIEGDYNYNDQSKEWYDQSLSVKSPRERNQIVASDSLYRAGYQVFVEEHEKALIERVPLQFSEDFKVDPRVHAIVMEYEEKLYKLIEKRKKDAIRQFEKEWAEQKAGVAKQQAQAEKESKKAESETEEKPDKESKKVKKDKE